MASLSASAAALSRQLALPTTTPCSTYVALYVLIYILLGYNILSILDWVAFSNDAYGWKNCRKILTNLPNNGGLNNGKPMNNAYGLFASGVRVIRAGGSINENGKVTGALSSLKAKRALTAMEKEELGSLAAFFNEESSDGGKEADMVMWGPVFNPTFFPKGTSLLEEQKGMAVKALMGNMPREAAYDH
ncbi:hypothetical protein VF21_09951 [Pseudogymnoascus sp. 05NY08]|nr:hypothetical protein VF21_09951 [Pseudogymnoascus sp. 05NY08]